MLQQLFRDALRQAGVDEPVFRPVAVQGSGSAEATQSQQDFSPFFANFYLSPA